MKNSPSKLKFGKKAQKFGKLPCKKDYRNLRLGNYLTPLPTPPSSYSALKRVYTKVGETDAAKLFPMDGNDQYGDCTIAALAHAITVHRGLVGVKKVPTEKAVVDLYKKLTGGPDTGLYELDVLNHWRHFRVSDTPHILAYVEVATTNHRQIKQAISIFGGVYLGFQVPVNCISQFNDHKTWTAGKLLQEGHAVFATGYTPTTIDVLTWGAVQKATWGWWDSCVDEAYVILPADAKLSGYSDAFDYQSLSEDLLQLAKLPKPAKRKASHSF